MTHNERPNISPASVETLDVRQSPEDVTLSNLAVRNVVDEATLNQAVDSGSESTTAINDLDNDVSTMVDDQYFMSRVTKASLLSAEEEVELAKSIEAGLFAQEKLDLARQQGAALDPVCEEELRTLVAFGTRDKEKFILSNTRLVLRKVNQFRAQKLTKMDLFQLGMAGIIKAVENFDYTKGYKFSSYAGWWILKELHDGRIKTDQTIRLTHRDYKMVGQVKKATIRLTETLDRYPTIEEIAADIQLTPEEVVHYQRLKNIQPLSLDKTILSQPEADTEFSTFLTDDTKTPEEQVVTKFEWTEESFSNLTHFANLDSRERRILMLRFGFVTGEPVPCSEVAKLFEISSQRVSMLQTKALDKIRIAAREAGLAQYSFH